MVRPQHSRLVAQNFSVGFLREPEPADIMQRESQIVSREHGVRVVSTQYAFAIDQDASVALLGLVHLTALVQGSGKIMPRK